MAVTEEFVEQVSQALDELGYTVEQQGPEDVIDDVSELNNNVTLPGIRVENNVMTGYVTMKLAVLRTYLSNAITAIQTQWTAWFGLDDTTEGGIQKTWKTWFTGRQSEWDVLKTDSQSATSAANTAAQNANTATAGAERVNANVSGMVVTITDRNGTQRTVDLSFDFYNSYPSVAAMNADVANIPASKLVSIATTDKTSKENARIYQKRSDGVMIYVADLDQASAEAWADWLNNMKPEINERIATADSDHTRANTDHQTATQDHSTASSDHTQAGRDHTTATQDHSQASQDHQTSVTQSTYAKNQGDYAKNMADHPAYVGMDDYWYLWDYATQAYVKGPYAKGDDLDYSTMTPEEIQRLVDNIKADLVFASVQTCEDIIDELN